MRLIKQPKGQCILYAYAMVLDADPEKMIKFIGHDGLTIVFSGAYPYKGYHPQELLEYCLSINKTVMIIEAIPNTEGPKGEIVLLWDQTFCKPRLQRYIDQYDCIIITDRHAVAWNHDERKIYDPNGIIMDMPNDYGIREIHIPIDIK